ncbi:16710_t:CDS:2 [Gigaspora rosea]|nr:16710_t:CDS:2 [Gigaspora rosea]
MHKSLVVFKNDFINTLSGLRRNNGGDELVEYLNDTPVEDIVQVSCIREGKSTKDSTYFKPPQYY